MVKITNLHEEEKPENTNPPEEEETLKELTPQEIKDITEKYTKEVFPFVLSNKEETKTEKINARITKTILNTLKVYSELNNTTVSKFIEDLITNFFEGKKINRDYYPIKETIIALPETPELIEEYIEKEVNLIVDMSGVTESVPLNPYDKQYSLCVSNDHLTTFLYIGSSNNYLDNFDHKNRVYYSPLEAVDNFIDSVFYDETVNPKELYFKNHLGLLMVPTSTINIYNKEKIGYDEEELENTFCYFLLVYEFDNKIKKVQLINRRKAIQLALTVENEDLLGFINSSEDIANYSPIKKEFEIREFQENYINELTEKVRELEEENRKLKEYKKSNDILINPEDKTVSKMTEYEEERIINDVTQELIHLNKKDEEVGKALKTIEKYYKDIEEEKQKCRNILKDLEEK